MKADLKVFIQDSTLIVTNHIDVSPSAGGAFLTLMSFLRGLISKKVVPKIYLRHVNEETRTFLERMGVSVLDLQEAQIFAGNQNVLTFIYGWGTDSGDIVESLKPAHYVIRSSGLGVPYCSSAGRQEEACWLSCNAFSYIRHAHRSINGFRSAYKGRAGKKYWQNALQLLFPAWGVTEFYRKTVPEIPSNKWNVTYELVHYKKSDYSRFAWEKHRRAKAAILLISKWEPHKGLLDILPLLHRQYEVYVIGGGSEIPIAKKLYTDGVHFLGSFDHNKLFDVLPSRRYVYLHAARFYEVWGRTNSEAMHAGIPTVVPDDSGVAHELRGQPCVYTYDRTHMKDLHLALETAINLPSDKWADRTKNALELARILDFEYSFPQWLAFFKKCHTLIGK